MSRNAYDKLPEWAKYVARDEDGGLWAYEDKPYKYDSRWFRSGIRISRVDVDAVGIFPDVKWSDREPTETINITNSGEENEQVTGYEDASGDYEQVLEDIVHQHFDPVTDPVQYHIGGIETIDIMRIVLTREEFKGYLKGNIIKYRERAMHKGKPEEDWAKAREYKRIYTIEFGHTDMSELKDEFDNGVGLGCWDGDDKGRLLGTQVDLRPKKEYR